MKAQQFLAGNTHDLQNGEMKELEIEGTKILLSRVDDRFYATGALCPHYQAPLVTGALCGTKVYCPWHHSVFDVASGGLCEPPALDGLDRYPVEVRGDDIYISMVPQKPKYISHTNTAGTNGLHFIVIGGGAAGEMAVETLRKEGFEGRITLIAKEAQLPYDRTALSKKFLAGKAPAEKLGLRDSNFFAAQKIDVQTGREVAAIDVANNTIKFAGGDTLGYDKLLLATGGAPIALKIPGADLDNVYVLRSLEDAAAITEDATAIKHIAIIGASFIGLEAAASLTQRGIKVSVIARESIPFAKKLGEDIGRLMLEIHKENGVDFYLNKQAASFGGKGKVDSVKLDDGSELKVDAVLLGIGVKPATSYITGLKLNEKDGSVMVDKHLQASQHVFAAGDIASFPDALTGASTRIEHWRTAQQQGRTAALNMMGHEEPVTANVPVFWTNHYKTRISYVGHATEWDEIIMDGSIAQRQFLAFYVKDGKVKAVASMKRDVESNRIEDMMRGGMVYTVNEMMDKLIEMEPVDLRHM